MSINLLIYRNLSRSSEAQRKPEKHDIVPSEGRGRTFESCRVRQVSQILSP
jgi:hypothetical protein